MPSKQILFVNDETDLTELVKLILQRHGYEVFAVTEGEQAFEIAHREHPDLVILDWVLDRLTGEDVLRKLRENPATADVPVLLVSALPDLRDRAASLGAEATLSKPYTGDDLREAIERVLKAHAPNG